MKKLGLIALAVVMALGAIGVGYAYWTDQLIITGTVGTGSLVVGIKDNLGTVADPLGGGATTASTNGLEIPPQTGWYKDITETITNAYPGYASGASVSVKNLGTVPVKFSVALAPVTGNFSLNNVIVTSFTVTKGALVFTGPTNVPFPVFEAAMVGLAGNPAAQLASGESATVVLNFVFNTAMDNTTMNQNAGFTITVNAKQFNAP